MVRPTKPLKEELPVAQRRNLCRRLAAAAVILQPTSEEGA